ncbi:MAG: hypothetical protein JNM09_24280 [Blastocatellia bacterium]|nr:hypothetical protein [Blastocatellia bacterium]
MSELTNPSGPNDSNDEPQFAESVAKILEANGLGDRISLTPTTVIECAIDNNGNRLLRGDVGSRRFFVTLSPALKGRLVGEDQVEDDAVRQHFGVNIIGEILKK